MYCSNCGLPDSQGFMNILDTMDKNDDFLADFETRLSKWLRNAL